MIDPAKSFKDSYHAKTWLDVVDGLQFQSAVSAAMLQMQMQMSAPADLGTAASYQFRMEGAKMFLSILMSLTEAPEERKSLTPLNLNHKV